MLTKDAYQEGRRDGYKDAMDFACEWMQRQLIDNIDNCGYPVVGSFDTTTLEGFIADFKKSMIKNLWRETSK